jgi:hypothetical protein
MVREEGRWLGADQQRCCSPAGMKMHEGCLGTAFVYCSALRTQTVSMLVLHAYADHNAETRINPCKRYRDGYRHREL